MTEPTVSLILGVHNHQPLGNFDEVMERAYADAYAPFLDVLSQFPEIRCSVHNTGILYDWFEAHHPEYIDRLREMVGRGQVEPLTGGYYEPILAVIPEAHRRGQIEKLSRRVEELFGTRPETLWLTERIWEPQLPSSLAAAGVSAVIMDDTHFKISGLSDENLYGYYFTEDLGHKVAAFPIDKQLRYTIPFREPEETINYLRGVATEDGDRVVVITDDGEKFGIWPGTHEWVYQKGWLHRFFTRLREEQHWLKLTSFREVLRTRRALGAVYIPTASYSEMMAWALPPDAARDIDHVQHENPDAPYQRFVRGGFWRNFFVKYPESNAMYSKMLWLANRAAKLPARKRGKIEDWIWRGQCNCAYWHGLFGGVYLNHLRVQVWKDLLTAERELDKQERKLAKGAVELEPASLSNTGDEIVRVRGEVLSVGINLTRGGHVFELSEKRKAFNVSNTMTRRPEAYHEKLLSQEEQGDGEVASIHDIVRAKEEGLADRLRHDRYRRVSWIEHILPMSTTLEQWVELGYEEQGDFVERPFAMEELPRGVRLAREADAAGGRLRIEKTLEIGETRGDLGLTYALTNVGESPIDALFGSEWGFSLQAGNTPDRYYQIEGVDLGNDNVLGSVGETRDVRRFSLVEEWLGLAAHFSLEAPATLWRCPVETISNSESGFERVYQSSVVLPLWSLSLPPGGRWQTKMVLTLESARE